MPFLPGEQSLLVLLSRLGPPWAMSSTGRNSDSFLERNQTPWIIARRAL